MCGQNASLDDFDWRDIANPDAQVRLKRVGLYMSAYTNVVIFSLWVGRRSSCWPAI